MTDQDREGVGPLDGAASAGVPARGSMDVGDREPIASEGKHHWRESTITEPGLDDRGNVFFAAVEMTRMPMILTDPNLPDNPIAFANKAFLDLTGYEEEEVLGRNCRFLQGAQTDRASVTELRDAVVAHRSIALELLNYKRDGTPFWNAVFIGPVFDTGGKLLYFFASQLDVTRRRNSEQTQRQAQKMEAIGQLTAGLAHDFNNLLQVVAGNLELLAARVEGERAQRYVENARAAADRGSKLTRQLLAFARKTRLDPRPTDLAALLREFSEVMQSSVGSAVRLEMESGEDAPPVLVDPEQLEMALLNVLINARDASELGGRITVQVVTRMGENGQFAGVEVRDEGHGMSPQVLERATEPFFSTKTAGRGTGLGLAMASGFAQQSRGRLEIESREGEGTLVRMLLPLAGDASTPQVRAGSASSRTVDGGSEHILVVEDTPEVLQLAVEILEGAGYRVSAAPAADEAMRLFSEAACGFDLLFTDLVMPGGMDGMMLAKELKGRDPDLGVLMTTGYNEELVADGPRRTQADVLGKPYRRSELLDRVRQALNRRGSSAARRRASDFGAVEA